MADPCNSVSLSIDKNDSVQIERWTREFNVTDEQLAQAIAKVGDNAADVELYLKGSRSTTNADTAAGADKTK